MVPVGKIHVHLAALCRYAFWVSELADKECEDALRCFKNCHIPSQTKTLGDPAALQYPINQLPTYPGKRREQGHHDSAGKQRVHGTFDLLGERRAI